MLFTVQGVMRLCRSRSVYRLTRYNHVRASSGANNKENAENNDNSKNFRSLLQKYQHKITFNSYLEHEKLELGYFKYHLKLVKQAKKQQQKQLIEKTLPALPISLQYFVDAERLIKDVNTDVTDAELEKPFQLPFASATRVEYDDKNEQTTVGTPTPAATSHQEEFDRTNMDKWMTNYEHFNDSNITSEESNDECDSDWGKYYGTPDPQVAVSSVPCGGCGALLQCSDPAIPGYLPSEILKHRDIDELKTIECQRCHFLKEYNIALDVNVEPEEYEKLLQSIRYIKSLVLLMVDILDFPCSIWPDIVDVIGKERPIFIVANKVDLLPGDSIGYLKRVKESLRAQINQTKLAEANIKYVALVSAKTGYGVEDLVTAMFKHWIYKGDVFLVGCTNVGKSSLFNALLQSDYCKVHAADIVMRATVSRWPGTTLNLLKFPINRPSGWKIHERSKRLKKEAKLMKMEKEIRKAQNEGIPNVETPALIGHIGRSFSKFIDGDDRINEAIERNQLTVLDDKHKLLIHSKWFYDTPGVIHPDQILSILSTEELLVTIPKNLIRPQTYYLHQGMSLFIGGLARLDHIECDTPCRFTVFCAETLPVTVTRTEDADDVYHKFVGTELFAVPSGGAERLKKWPGLERHDKLLEFSGEGPKVCCGDVVLSSVGWVAVTAKKGSLCRVAAWTPGARGVHRRQPSVLPFAVNLKGKRLRDTPAYMVGKKFSENDG